LALAAIVNAAAGNSDAAGRPYATADAYATCSADATIIATTTTTTKAICCGTETNKTIAMHHLAIATAAAGTVSVQTGVVSHVLCLTGLAIYLDIIDLDIACSRVIVILDVDITRCRAGIDIILIAGCQRPATHIHPANFQINML
jgi:hypothetical protein